MLVQFLDIGSCYCAPPLSPHPPTPKNITEIDASRPSSANPRFESWPIVLCCNTQCVVLQQSLVAQKLMFVGRTDSGKMMALRQLLSGGGGLAADGSNVGGLLPPILVFVSTKARAQVSKGLLDPSTCTISQHQTTRQTIVMWRACCIALSWCRCCW